MAVKTVRRIFIFFLFYLPFQYALVGIFGYFMSEPWPAFVFPGFKNVYTYEEGYEISDAVFEIHPQNSSEVMILKPREFFPEVPNSQISGFMRTHFSSEETTSSFDKQTKNWLRDNAARHTGHPPEDIQVVWLKKYYSNPENDARQDSTVENMRFTILRGGNLDE